MYYKSEYVIETVSVYVPAILKNDASDIATLIVNSRSVGSFNNSAPDNAALFPSISVGVVGGLEGTVNAVNALDPAGWDPDCDLDKT